MVNSLSMFFLARLTFHPIRRTDQRSIPSILCTDIGGGECRSIWVSSLVSIIISPVAQPFIPPQLVPTPQDAQRGFVSKRLWAWSRHANFACEQATWCILYAFVPLTFDCQNVHWSQFVNYALIAPLAMSVLFYASTVYSEAESAKKYPEYSDHQNRVGLFLPIHTVVVYYNVFSHKQTKKSEEENVCNKSQ